MHGNGILIYSLDLPEEDVNLAEIFKAKPSDPMVAALDSSRQQRRQTLY